MGYAMARPLYREQELAFRTQDVELKERTLGAGELLPGTPGSLALRSGSGRGYWYRVFDALPGKVREELVCKEGDEKALNAIPNAWPLPSGPAGVCPDGHRQADRGGTD